MAPESNERKALVTFFEAAEGKRWRHRQKWQSKDSFLPLGSLYGVSTANENATVIRLDLAGNLLGGKLSPAVGDLYALEALDLSGNSVRGHLPEALAKLKELVEINLSMNEFGGRVPRAFAGANMPRLEKLNLSSNKFSYLFIERLCSLTTLKELCLNKNELGGDTPGQFASLTNLTLLDLGCNDFMGPFPEFISAHMPLLKTLDLSINHFVGSLPDEAMMSLMNMVHLNLSGNGFFGPLPRKAMRLMCNLQTCDLSDNKFTGELPTCFYRHKQLIRLDLSDNQLEGTVPPNFIALTGKLRSQCKVQIRDNGDFSLPHTIGILRVGLERLDMAHCRLVGTIPADFGGLSRLQEVLLNDNKLDGTIPVALANAGTISHLKKIDLSNNMLSGGIPECFSTLTVLNHLNLSQNELSGDFHRSFRNLLPLGTYDRADTLLNVSQNRFRTWVPESSQELHTVQTLVRTAHALHLAGTDPAACSDASDPRTCWYRHGLDGKGDQRECEVDLRGSPQHLEWVGDYGVAMATGIRLASRLLELDVRGHPLGPQSITALSESLRENESVRALWSDYHPMCFDLRGSEPLWGLKSEQLDDSEHTAQTMCNLVRARPVLLHAFCVDGRRPPTTWEDVEEGPPPGADAGTGVAAILCTRGTSVYRPLVHPVVVTALVRAFFEERDCFRYVSALTIHGHQFWMALLIEKDSSEMRENITIKLCRLLEHFKESLAFVADDTEEMHRSVEQCLSPLHRRLVDSVLWFGRYYVPHKHALPIHRSKKVLLFIAQDVLDTDPVTGAYRRVCLKLTTSRSRWRKDFDVRKSYINRPKRSRARGKDDDDGGGGGSKARSGAHVDDPAAITSGVLPVLRVHERVREVGPDEEPTYFVKRDLADGVLEAVLSRMDERRPVLESNDDILGAWTEGGFHGSGFLARAEAELLDCTVLPLADGDLGSLELATKTIIPDFLLAIPPKIDHYAEALVPKSLAEALDGSSIPSLPVLPDAFPASPMPRSSSLESLGSLSLSPSTMSMSMSYSASKRGLVERQAVPTAHTVLREVLLSLQWLNDRGVAHTTIRPESVLRVGEKWWFCDVADCGPLLGGAGIRGLRRLYGNGPCGRDSDHALERGWHVYKLHCPQRQDTGWSVPPEAVNIDFLSNDAEIKVLDPPRTGRAKAMAVGVTGELRTVAAEMWGLGCLLYQMVSPHHLPLFDASEDRDVTAKLRDAHSASHLHSRSLNIIGKWNDDALGMTLKDVFLCMGGQTGLDKGANNDANEEGGPLQEPCSLYGALAIDLLWQLLQPYPTERPGDMAEVLSHPFLTVDWREYRTGASVSRLPPAYDPYQVARCVAELASPNAAAEPPFRRRSFFMDGHRDSVLTVDARTVHIKDMARHLFTSFDKTLRLLGRREEGVDQGNSHPTSFVVVPVSRARLPKKGQVDEIRREAMNKYKRSKAYAVVKDGAGSATATVKVEARVGPEACPQKRHTGSLGQTKAQEAFQKEIWGDGGDGNGSPGSKDTHLRNGLSDERLNGLSAAEVSKKFAKPRVMKWIPKRTDGLIMGADANDPQKHGAAHMVCQLATGLSAFCLHVLPRIDPRTAMKLGMYQVGYVTTAEVVNGQLEEKLGAGPAVDDAAGKMEVEEAEARAIADLPAETHAQCQVRAARELCLKGQGELRVVQGHLAAMAELEDLGTRTGSIAHSAVAILGDSALAEVDAELKSQPKSLEVMLVCEKCFEPRQAGSACVEIDPAKASGCDFVLKTFPLMLTTLRAASHELGPSGVGRLLLGSSSWSDRACDCGRCTASRMQVAQGFSQNKEMYAQHVVDTIRTVGERLGLPFPTNAEERMKLKVAMKGAGGYDKHVEERAAALEAAPHVLEMQLRDRLGPKRTLFPRGQKRGMCASLIRELLKGHDKRNVWGDLQRVVLPLEGEPVLWMCPGCVLSVQQSLNTQTTTEDETKRVAMREVYARLEKNEQFCMSLEEERNRAVDGANRHREGGKEGCILS